jgi:two-component sensor histidine kinase
VIHELATNAAKYGALSAADGRIETSWALNGDVNPRLELIWAEQGGPKVESLLSRSFGIELIERGIPFELQGEAKLEVVDGALRCRISVPATPDLLSVGSAPSGPGPG